MSTPKKINFPIPKNLSNVTIRERKIISNSTSKLFLKRTRIPRTISTSSLNDFKSKDISQKKYFSINKKCISLQDLSPANKKNLHVKRRLFSQMENEGSSSPRDIDNPSFSEEKSRKLAYRVYISFLRNALNKLVQKYDTQNDIITDLTRQVNNTRLQISTLKSLLGTDESFFKNWIREFTKLKKRVLQLTNERDELRMENHNFETSLEELREKLTEVKVELMNDKNSLEQARSESVALESQLEKERAKIHTLRNELKKTSDKVLELQRKKSSRSFTNSSNSIRRNVDKKKSR